MDLRFSQRSLEQKVGIVLIGALAVLTAIIAVAVWLRGDTWILVIGSAASALIFGALFWAYSKGRNEAPLILVALLAILPGAFLDELTPAAVVASYVAPAIGLIFLRAPWITFIGLLSISGLLIRSGQLFAPENTTMLLNSVVVIGALAVARQVLDDTNRRALNAAEEARQAQLQADEANRSTQHANDQLLQQTDQQQRLIDLLNDLEVPAISIRNGVLLVPLLGNLDTRRAARLMESVLAAVHSRRARLLIFDIAGMSIADTASIQALHRTIGAIQLLGCDVQISGIRAEVAQTLVHAQISMPNVRFVRHLSDVIDTLLPDTESAAL
ncbi:MAG: STAS domain-containing protein [Oscillochloris sp.]|nr:STAS domain-containing protein [Oscillochloris sp.]